MLWGCICGVENVPGVQTKWSCADVDSRQRQQCPVQSCGEGLLSEPCKVEAAGWHMAVLENQDDRMAWTLHADTVKFVSLLCHLGARQAIELSGYPFS